MTKRSHRQQMNNRSPREFTDVLVAGFDEPDKAINALTEVADIYEEEAQQLRLQLEILSSKIRRITELRDSFERKVEVANS